VASLVASESEDFDEDVDEENDVDDDGYSIGGDLNQYRSQLP